jgi:hypothetical protein
MSEAQTPATGASGAESNLNGSSMFEVLSTIDPPKTNGSSGGKPVIAAALEGKENGNESNGAAEEKGEASEEGLQVADEDTDSKEVVAPTTPPPTVLKAKVGDKEIDLDEESVIKIKVDGKEESVSIKQLKHNYQGKIPWDKHYKETKALEASLKEKDNEIRR